jgi:hypothetical protein
MRSNQRHWRGFRRGHALAQGCLRNGKRVITGTEKGSSLISINDDPFSRSPRRFLLAFSRHALAPFVLLRPSRFFVDPVFQPAFDLLFTAAKLAQRRQQLSGVFGVAVLEVLADSSDSQPRRNVVAARRSLRRRGSGRSRPASRMHRDETPPRRCLKRERRLTASAEQSKHATRLQCHPPAARRAIS